MRVDRLVGIDVSKEKSLSLQEAVELALRNNRDIEVERINMEVSQFGLKGAEGHYDPVFSFGPSFTSRLCPVAGSKMPSAPLRCAEYQILPLER